MNALIGMANSLNDCGEPKKAIEFYEKIIKIDDDNADAYYNLANS